MKVQESTEPMTINRGMPKHDRGALQPLIPGGGNIPASLAAKSMVAMKSMLLEKRDAEVEQRVERATLKARSPIAMDDPANRQTLDASLRLNKGVANAEVPFPEAAPANSGVWVLSGTVAPPFDIAHTMALPFAFVIPILGDPTMSGAASQDGQIRASVVTGISDGLNAGREIAMVGFHFTPPGPGTLKICASPTYSFAWKINSMDNEDIFDVGSISLSIGHLNSEGEIYPVVEDFQNIYSKYGTGNDEESGVQKSLSVSLQVTPGSLYSCCVYLDVGAFAFWPESLASSMMSATVPSISYEFVEKFSNL